MMALFIRSDNKATVLINYNFLLPSLILGVIATLIVTLAYRQDKTRQIQRLIVLNVMAVVALGIWLSLAGGLPTPPAVIVD